MRKHFFVPLAPHLALSLEPLAFPTAFQWLDILWQSVMNREATLRRSQLFMPKLIVKSGSQGGREIELSSGTHHVGRTPDNEIVVVDPSISKHHCELHVSDIGIAVLDLGSTNGTFINRTQVARGMLQNGDVLTLGQIDFSVELEEVTIAIPEMRAEEAPGAAFMEDGTPACFNHRNQAALFRCTKCEAWWCAECVRQMKRLSGESLHFCPECSAGCVPIEREQIARRKSFLERVGDTLRINRKG